MSIDVVTFGCRLNIAELEAIRHAASRLGDAVVVNTCAVTAEAVRQARQNIRRIKRERPEARIVVTGCAAQIEPGTFAAMPEVDRVIGNTEKTRSAILDRRRRARLRRRHHGGEAPRWTAVDHLEGHTRAFLQVQNGCDHRCTFCIIPFGRGNSRSLPIDDCVTQARRLAARGHRELVLTGVDITSYGADITDTPRLGALVKRILKDIPELKRLRLSSIDSVEADGDLLDALANEPRLMPHLHLSLQSGDDLILKRMKRRHTRADAIAFCDQVRRLRPDVAFGADIIAGFPTESDAMFARSLDLVDECGLTRAARLSVFAAAGHAGRAHAAGRARGRQGARAAVTRNKRGRAARASRRASRRAAAGADRARRRRPHRAIRHGQACGAGRAGCYS